MNALTAGILTVAVLAAMWLPACFMIYVLGERQFTLRTLFAATTIVAVSIATLTFAYRIVY